MHSRILLMALGLVLTVGTVGTAQDAGTPLPAPTSLEDFAQTPAKTFDDLIGRTVLIEFFAFW